MFVNQVTSADCHLHVKDSSSLNVSLFIYYYYYYLFLLLLLLLLLILLLLNSFFGDKNINSDKEIVNLALIPDTTNNHVTTQEKI